MKNTIFMEILTAARIALFTMVVTGIIYPLVVTGCARAVAGEEAQGSLVTDSAGRTVGSELIGQNFTLPGYLHPRPSAAGEGYDAGASGGSNLAPTSEKLRARVEAEVDRLRRENPEAPLPVPLDLVTASASGLDPHLSPEGALWQAPRIAAARKVSVERVRAILNDRVEGRLLGFIGEPRVNVLLANLELDSKLGTATPGGSERD